MPLDVRDLNYFRISPEVQADHTMELYREKLNYRYDINEALLRSKL